MHKTTKALFLSSLILLPTLALANQPQLSQELQNSKPLPGAKNQTNNQTHPQGQVNKNPNSDNMRGDNQPSLNNTNRPNNVEHHNNGPKPNDFHPQNGRPDKGPHPIGSRYNGGQGYGHSNFTDLATVAVVGGLTYYILDNVFYQKHDNDYIAVQTPSGYTPNTTASGEPTQIDYQGKRYYVKDNRFYQRDISGAYIEVPKPAGL